MTYLVPNANESYHTQLATTSTTVKLLVLTAKLNHIMRLAMASKRFFKKYSWAKQYNNQ